MLAAILVIHNGQPGEREVRSVIKIGVKIAVPRAIIITFAPRNSVAVGQKPESQMAITTAASRTVFLGNRFGWSSRVQVEPKIEPDRMADSLAEWVALLTSRTGKLESVSFKIAQWLNLGLLVVLALTLVALILGVPVPRWAFAGLVVIQTLVRAWRDWRWGSERRRRSIGFNLVLTLVLAYLILTVR
jgi:hypothetical protein